MTVRLVRLDWVRPESSTGTAHEVLEKKRRIAACLEGGYRPPQTGEFSHRALSPNPAYSSSLLGLRLALL